MLRFKIGLLTTFAGCSGGHDLFSAYRRSLTIARALSNSFAGIAPTSAPAFIAAQLAGGAVGYAVVGWLFKPDVRADGAGLDSEDACAS